MKSLALLFALSAPAFSAIAISLPGTTETATWALTASNYSPATYTSATLWTASPTSGTASAQLQKVSGLSYVSGGNFVYTNGTTGDFRFYDDSPQASLQTIVLQGAISANTMAPTLYYNGGTTGITANYFQLSNNAPAYNDYAWQWDLSGLGTISSYEILFSGHIAFTSLKVDTGSSFIQAVPEPSSALLGAVAVSFTFIRRRRA